MPVNKRATCDTNLARKRVPCPQSQWLKWCAHTACRPGYRKTTSKYERAAGSASKTAATSSRAERKNIGQFSALSSQFSVKSCGLRERESKTCVLMNVAQRGEKAQGVGNLGAGNREVTTEV